MKHLAYKCCAFTGHRPQKLSFGFDEDDARCIAFKKTLTKKIEALIGEGYARFLSGGALGMDMFSAEAVCTLKEKYPWILLEIAVPYDDQCAKWPEAYQARYARMLSAADTVTYISHVYETGCLFRRNRYLVTQADLLLAAYNGTHGGTEKTIAMAHDAGCDVCIIPVE